MPDRAISRREALALALAAAGTWLTPARTASLVAPRQQAAAAPGLIVRNARPLDAESPLEALRTFETRNDLFFVRSHHLVPAIAGSWTLTVDGDVANPLTLPLAEVRRMPLERRSAVIECAGNGRGLFELPATSGVQWGLGAVGNATWTGVPLRALLERAGVQDAAQHFWMEAADRSPLAGAPKFIRSIPRDIALSDALVAVEMNGRPIPLQHGGPLRLVVPGWYGMASTKWLTHIHARARESDNHFMARGYRWADGSPLNFMRVKSVITAPLAGEQVKGAHARVAGVAWTGAGTVSRVDISTDGGQTWQPARFTTDPRAGTWRLWEAQVPLGDAGERRVRARAIDTGGQMQPDRATPNPAGYGNNSIHEVRFDAG